MSTVDIELAKTEIEILKICQHPNIIGIHDVYENKDFFYISMQITIKYLISYGFM